MAATIKPIESLQGLNEIFSASRTGPVILFKHSAACGISAHIFEMLSSINAVINLVVVQNHRDVSNEIESLTGYRHHSPQAFVIRDAKVVYHATHYAIDPVEIESHLSS
ncbi:MAG TPA: bacillithiol system redox-active protein YtxJ [Pyrinomonadaceae bacterium]|nr:bacillithiol system redox-active protein YtxJ [Pyrinomonadaceae bacterium]